METQAQEETQPMPMQYEQQPPPVYMEQPKTPLQGILANLNTRVVKEPRGFMKILQFVFGICAFATTTSFTTFFSFVVACLPPGKNVTIQDSISYPFRVDSINTEFAVCEGNHNKIHISGDFSSDSEFFVAVGVLAMLYAIAALVLYCLFSSLYDNNELVPVVDCGVHVVFGILWLAASSAWANSLSNLQGATELSVIMDQNKDICGTYKCIPEKGPSYSKLVISVILGFLNMFLWGSNLWFLYKETRYFKEKTSATDGSNETQRTA